MSISEKGTSKTNPGSGIHTAQDVGLMREHGVHTFLVGEAFMRAPEPGEKLRELFFKDTP